MHKNFLDKNQILKRYDNYEDRLFVNNVLQFIEGCKRGYAIKNTHFLDPRQQDIASSILEKCHEVEFTFSGGIENCERKMCFVYSRDFDFDCYELPIEVLRLEYEGSKKLSHRDFLGSLTGSGIKREMLGDIIIEERCAYLACSKELGQYIQYNVDKVGNERVSICVVDESIERADKVKIITTTVASLRLDAIISSGYGISRGTALDVIKAKKVRLNWEETDTPSKEVKQGDVISIRGKGRICLDEVGGSTKKDRVRIVIKKYI